MGFFMTEQRTEDLLEQETRTLRKPDGSRIQLTAFKAFWKAYDFLILCGLFTPESLSRIALNNALEMGVSFERSMVGIVWKANKHSRRILGFDCFCVRPDGDR